MCKVRVAPSILSGDFGSMSRVVSTLEENGADLIHCDVMDGVFVPNISFGPKMIKDIRRATSLELDAHLMIVHPENYIRQFAEAGANYITVHIEAVDDYAEQVLSDIRALGVKCGIVLNPETPVEKIEKIIPLCDMVLLMSVHPGFGGQKFIEPVLEKIKRVRQIIDRSGKRIELEIDGGICEQNIEQVKLAGADVIVAGSYVFHAENMKQTIARIRG